MLDYNTQVKPLEDAGLTDAEIAQHLASVTAKSIPCYDAKLLLEESGLVEEDPVTAQRVGSLIDHYSALPAGDYKKLLGWFISHVFGRGQNVVLNEYPRSVQVAGMLAGLPAEMSDAVDELLQLGGGQPFAGTVEDDVAAARQADADEQAEVQRYNDILALQAEIENTWINPASVDGVSTAAEVRAAIKAGL